jgi:hypothetical protein
MSRLNTFRHFPWEVAGFESVLPYCEIFADRHCICDDCPRELRDLAAAFCAARNAAANQSALAAYRAGLLP